jgi:lysophospholipase L1-like esterase
MSTARRARWLKGGTFWLSLGCAGAPAVVPRPPPQELQAPPGNAPPPAPPPPPSVPERRADVAEEAADSGVLGASWHERHQALLQAPGRRAAQLVVLGDGIADGWQRSRAFQKQWRERKPLNPALPGDQTQQLVWRIEHGVPDGLTPRLVLLMAGSENLAHGFSPAQTARGVAAVLQRVRERLPGSRVLLLGLLPAGQSPLDPLRVASDASNVELRAVASAAQLTLADVGGVFLEANDSITPGMLGDDGLPTALGYEALTITVSLLAQRLLEDGH